MPYDYRKPLVESLKLMASYERPDAHAENPLLRNAWTVLRNALHHCLVWRQLPRPSWTSGDPAGAKIEDFIAQAEPLFMQRQLNEDGWEDEWSDDAIRNGLRWRTVRHLARGAWVPAQGVARFVPELKTALPPLPVTSYRVDRVPNPPEPADLVEEHEGLRKLDLDRHRLRQALLYATARYGHIGPEDPAPGCDFWLAEDVYNDERYHYLELHNPASLTPRWFREMVDTLAQFPGWGLCCQNVRDSYAILFADRVMVTGKLSGCRTFEDVARALPPLVQLSAAEEESE